MSKRGNGGGIDGFLKSVWHSIVISFLGTKWQMKEMLTKQRQMDLSTASYRKGDVAVITGGTRGIGFETIKGLLQVDMHVIMGCRQVSEGEEAVRRIRSDGVESGKVDVLGLDLMSLTSVRDFAQQILNRHLPITILINNAGVMFPPYAVSEDGYESQFQINYLGHFLLTHLLLPNLAQTGTPSKVARIVNVSSIAHYGGKINFDDLQMEKFYSPKMGYMRSKMMQVIWTEDLNDRLTKANLNVRVYSLHPGVVHTDLYKHLFISKFTWCIRCLFLSPDKGTQTSLYVALSPEAESGGGKFFANCQIVAPNPKVHDPALQKKLFDVSCDLTGITEFTPPPPTHTAPKLLQPTTTDLELIVDVN